MSSAPTKTDVSDPGPFRSIGIVGLGVMGGSLAKGLHRRGGSGEVVGWDLDPSHLDGGERAGAITRRAACLEEAVEGMELVVLAVPVQAACALMGRLPHLLSSDAILHDLASLKTPVQAAVAARGLESRWVGGHPMCGSEASGFEAALPDLYDDARVWIVADDAAEAGARRVEALWRSVGAHPRRMDAPPHDALMGTVSHLPQMTANLLGQVMAEAGVSVADLGPGGRDTTRLAGSSPDVWVEILAHAPPTLATALRRMGKEATGLADAIEAGDLDAVRRLMVTTRAWRRHR